MTRALLGIAVLVLFAAAAWRYSTYWPTLHHNDRVGAALFFAVVGVCFVVAALALITHPVLAG